MRQRSSYPNPFKAQIAQKCLQPGVTLSSVAISHGINANVIRKWLPLYRDQSPAALPAFVPLRATPKRQTEALAIIELPSDSPPSQWTYVPALKLRWPG
jgi:transposase